MKLNKIIGGSALMIMMMISNSCSDLLEEKPQSNVVPSAFGTAPGLLGGIAGVYNSIRGSWGTEGFFINQMAGTDEILSGGSASVGEGHALTYNGMTSADFSGGFGLYSDINALNGILQFGPTTPGLDAATLKAYLGQAQFLRAFLYFYLVQTYGNIPLHTEFITVPSQADEPSTPAEIYQLIVSDLNDAIVNLPAVPTAPFLGKPATAAAAKWLLAKVYLTRGWLTGSTADFTSAYTTAKDLIDNKATYGLDLWQNYADAFLPANDYGKETIFVSDHSTDTKYGGPYSPGSAGNAGINITPWMGLFNAPGVLGANSTLTNGIITSGGPNMLTRDVQFGRPFTRIRPNMPPLKNGPNSGKSYLLDQAFSDRTNDSRFGKTFQTVWLQNSKAGGGQVVNGDYSGPGVTGSRGQLTCGLDTAVWFPTTEVTTDPQKFGTRPFKGIIVTPTMQSVNVYPYMSKYADPSRASQNDPSARPFVIARFSDVYLIAAEAAFKGGGTLQQAADMINVVRQRAAFRSGAPYTAGGAFGLSTTLKSTMNGDPYPAGLDLATAQANMTIAPGSVTLDFILDERSREFYGEGLRWLDLVRTQSLLSRVAAWNPIEAGANIKSTHILRPIPLDQVNLVVAGPAYPQNPGY